MENINFNEQLRKEIKGLGFLLGMRPRSGDVQTCAKKARRADQERTCREGGNEGEQSGFHVLVWRLS